MSNESDETIIERYQASNTNLQISRISYNVMSPDEIRKEGLFQCINYNLYTTPNRDLQNFSVMDKRLGIIEAKKLCPTCSKSYEECMGHFGHIELALPIFHHGFFKSTLHILKCICKNCGHVLLNKEDKFLYDLKCSQENLNMNKKKSLAKQILEKCKKVKICFYCKAHNGMVKKVALMRIVHEPFKTLKPDSKEVTQFKLKHEEVIEETPDLGNYINNKYQELLHPVKVRGLFKRIPHQEYNLLLLDPNKCLPIYLLWSCIPVPPLSIRPSVSKGGSRSEMGMTIQLSEMVFINEYFRRKLYEADSNISNIMGKWDLSQYLGTLYINSEVTGVPQDFAPKKKHKGLSQRLKGKQGRFRCNLSGKRVNYTARTVISPNPHLRINEVGIPLHCAKILTYPETVTVYNIDSLKAMVLNGSDTHPGANFVQILGKPNRSALHVSHIREDIARNLKIGDVVFRHLIDGDVVLFNRQPSLHKLSIMSHIAKVLPHRTFRFNECVCTPYNADFDGDEMNVHLPQTPDARAEALLLMSSKSNLVTPKNGELIVAAIQDFITGAYILTNKDTFFDKFGANKLLGTIITTYPPDTLVELPPPAILRPQTLWTGKQLFSLIIRPNSESPIKINLDTRTKMKSDLPKNSCPDDTFVVIRNSEIMSGYLDKSILGSGSKKNVFYVLLRDYGEDVAAEAMWRMAKMMAYYTSSNGFSIGINDVMATKELNLEKDKLLKEGENLCSLTIQNYKNKTLVVSPGCTPKQQMEGELLKTLSDIREHAGTQCKKHLPKENAPVLMSVSGSKGSLINVSQMVALVGQQSISGNLVPYGYIDRTLPFFDKEENSPQARGFVSNSFRSGLTTNEFWFHTMAGREGLVDTAVKTADSGYMQRRLIKGLEDISIHQDGSVRTSQGELIQIIYGDDGLDPSMMETDAKPVDFNRLMTHVQSVKPLSKDSHVLNSHDVMEKARNLLINFHPVYKEEILEYLESYAEKISNVLKKANLFKDSKTSKVYIQQKLLTDKQLGLFVDTAATKYDRSIIEPGTAIGAICAQSIGEPTTQMTLKTFHFAGVASMNITQGVPRIKEIIDAKKDPSTPIITIKLLDPTIRRDASNIKKKMVQYVLKDISNIDFLITQDNFMFRISVTDENKHEIRTHDIQEALLNSKLKFAGSDIYILNELQMLCELPAKYKKDKGFAFSEEFIILLGKVLISGLNTIKQAVIKEEKNEHYLLAEGSGLRDVMWFDSVDCDQTVTNNIIEMYQVFGIETAKKVIMEEMNKTMGGHGIAIDPRHFLLLSEVMCSSGEVIGFNRQGFSKTKSCTLMLASYEQTMDHLFEAAYHGQTDMVTGVSESIIIGNPIRQGTNCFNLSHKYDPITLPEPVDRRASDFFVR